LTFAVSASIGAIFTPKIAYSEINYEGIKFLGGGDRIDLNNANIRSYLKLKGMYPGVASKIVSNKIPFKSIADVYNIPGLTDAEKAILKQYEDKFIVCEARPEYFIDRINNGLYR
jgi:photosystem II PsbU protein